jgi:hypothetical protein
VKIELGLGLLARYGWTVGKLVSSELPLPVFFPSYIVNEYGGVVLYVITTNLSVIMMMCMCTSLLFSIYH